MVGLHLHRIGHIAIQLRVRVDDFHGAPPEHVAGADHDGVGDFLGNGDRLAGAAGNSIRRLFDIQIPQNFLKALPVFRCVDGVRASSPNFRG